MLEKPTLSNRKKNFGAINFNVECIVLWNLFYQIITKKIKYGQFLHPSTRGLAQFANNGSFREYHVRLFLYRGTVYVSDLFSQKYLLTGSLCKILKITFLKKK